jgi:hypothetical protein
MLSTTIRNLAFFAFCLFTFYFLSCSDNSSPVTSSIPVPCTKSISLLTPPDDTSWQTLPDSTYFSWSSTCNPVKYHFQVTSTSNQWYPDPNPNWFITDTFYWGNYVPPNPGNSLWWRIIAYYGNPVTDSIVSPAFRISRP